MNGGAAYAAPGVPPIANSCTGGGSRQCGVDLLLAVIGVVVLGVVLEVRLGADAETAWLPPEIALDDHGFVLTGADVVAAGGWECGRDPYPLETSVPGTFAFGDVRLSPVKRVAAAVGEGSMAIAFVHQYLKEPETSVVRRPPAESALLAELRELRDRPLRLLRRLRVCLFGATHGAAGVVCTPFRRAHRLPSGRELVVRGVELVLRLGQVCLGGREGLVRRLGRRGGTLQPLRSDFVVRPRAGGCPRRRTGASPDRAS